MPGSAETTSASPPRLVHDAAPNSTLIEDWMDGDARTAAMDQFAAFLAEPHPLTKLRNAAVPAHGAATLLPVSEMDALRDWLGVMFGQIGERFDAVDARFDTVETRLDAMDTRFDAMDARFNAMDARFDRIEGRIDEIVVVNGTLIDEVARINARLGSDD